MATNLSDYASAFVATVAAVIATFAIRHNISINRRNKRIDIIAQCNARYDALYDIRLKLFDSEKPRREISSYYGRYWGLKSDQFDYWLAGFVDIETFTDWCFMTVKAFADNKPLQAKNDVWTTAESLSFDWGWTEVGQADHQVTNPWFAELTWSLRDLGVEWEAAAEQLGHDPLNSSIEGVQSNARIGLLQILQVVIVKSSTYRMQLQHEMTQEEYARSAKEHRWLGLASTHRANSLQLVNSRPVYWYLRRKPILGPFLARWRGVQKSAPQDLGISDENRMPRPSRLSANRGGVSVGLPQN